MTTDTLDFPPVDPAALDHARAKADWMASQQLAIIETGVAELTPTARALAELEHRLKGIAYQSLNTGAGMQAAVDDRRTLIDLRVGLGKLVEAANKKDRADTKTRCDQRDAGCLKLTTAIKALEEPIDQQIKAEEARKADEKRKRDAAEADRKAKHESGINRIRAYVVKASEPGMTAERIAVGISQIEAIPTPTAEAWEEFAVPAANAICETLEKMRALHAKTLADEAAAAEAERVRKENEELRAQLAAAEAAAQAAAKAAAELEAARAVEASKISTGMAPAADEPANTREGASGAACLATQDKPQQGANRDASAGQSHVAEGSASPTGRGADGPIACGAAPVSLQASEQISVATIERGAARIDATASRVERIAGSPELAAPMNLSTETFTPAAGTVIRAPGGPFTLIEPADKPADPDEKPTLKLGDLNDWLAPIQINAAGLALLGITHSGTDKAAKLYKPSDRERIRVALIRHLERLA